jgi:ribosomal protein L24E
MPAIQTRPQHYNCLYCGQTLNKGTGQTIGHHRQEYKTKLFYFCENNHELCFVACHKGTEIPLGYATNKAGRHAKLEAHKAFDTLWMGITAHMTRTAAYQLLADKMGLHVDDCHIAWFSVYQCRQVIEIVSDYWFNKEIL